jgi:type I restriction enzyme S subunit
VIRISDIQDGVISLKSAVHSLTDVSDAFKVSKGDILIAMSGATTGKIGEYQNNEVAYINQRVGNIKPFGMNKKLLLFLLQSDFFIHYLNSILTVGAQPNISSQQICAFGFMLPKNTAEQQKIAECLSTLDEQIKAESAELDALKEHKKGLMQQLFPQPTK